MISMDEIKERVILVAVDTDGSDQAERSQIGRAHV